MSVYDLLSEVRKPQLPPAYMEKMHHEIPDAESVKRVDYLLQRAKDKVILDIGCTGVLSAALAKVAKEYHGIDNQKVKNLPNFYMVELEQTDSLPKIPDVELVIASEVIEHLSNAGHFLKLLKRYHCPIIITAPNAFSVAGKRWLQQGIEVVNKDHVAWYSWYTLKALLERNGFEVLDFRWYNGEPPFSEGLIFEVSNGKH